MNIGILAFVGLIVGAVGGMFGVGGSIILIPALNEVLGPNQHLYQSAAMIVNLFVSLPAILQHRRAGAIDGATVRRIVPAALVAVLLGVTVSELRFFSGTGEAYLRLLFGLFLFSCAAYDVYRLSRRAEPSASLAGKSHWKLTALVALPTGFAAGLLGVGGGILAVPLQRRFLGVPIRNAIANSAAIIVATSLVGSIYKNIAYAADPSVTAGTDPMLLALILIPTAVMGSLVGSRLTHIVPLRVVKGGVVMLLLVSSVRMIQTAMGAIGRSM